jgi:hypothetical protein
MRAGCAGRLAYTAFFLLPNEDLVATDNLELVWRGNYQSVYRVNPITRKPDEKSN